MLIAVRRDVMGRFVLPPALHTGGRRTPPRCRPRADRLGARLVGPVMRETIQGEGKLLATHARTFYADFMISGPVAAASAGRGGTGSALVGLCRDPCGGSE
jgi:hypothetical protein